MGRRKIACIAACILLSGPLVSADDGPDATRTRYSVHKLIVVLAERCFPATQPLFIAIGDNAFEQVLEPVPGSGDVRWQYTPSPEIPPVHASIRFGKSRSDCVNPDVQRDRDDIALDVATYTFSNCYKPGETITFEADPPTLV